MLEILLFPIGFIVTFRLLRYLTTPIFKWIGYYQYYAPMFFLMPFTPRYFEIHLGTSWDFFMNNTNSLKDTMSNIALGLFKLSEDIEKGKYDKRAWFKGNTYYLKESTVKNFGFRSRKLNLIENVLFMMNYIELTVLISLSKRRFMLAPIKNLQIIEISAEELVARKNVYLNLFRRLASADKNTKKLLETNTVAHEQSRVA